MMTKFEKALGFVLHWHNGQKDKAGEPYIKHLLRVAMQLETEEEQLVALLHDSLEDCPADQVEGRAREIAHTFGSIVYGAVLALTRSAGEDYLKEYIPRLMLFGGLAVWVKLADLKDNMNLMRLPGDMTAEDVKRMKKYHRASMLLHGCV